MHRSRTIEMTTGSAGEVHHSSTPILAFSATTDLFPWLPLAINSTFYILNSTFPHDEEISSIYDYPMFNFLLDLLFPRHSLTGSEGEWITKDERERMRLFPIRLHRELLRKKGIKSLDCLIAAGSYHSSPLLKKAIKTFKYGRIPGLGQELGKRIVDCLPGLLLLPTENRPTFHFPLSTFHSPIVCPVPLHWTRIFHRGFNQALVLAQIIGTEKSWPVAELLKRTRATGHQAWRKRDDRLTAVTGAFAWSSTAFQVVVGTVSPVPRCVLLVDDICTTGATLDACAKALKDAGVKHVVGLVGAYG